MKLNRLYRNMMLAAAFVCLGACDPWRDDLELNKADLDKDLYEIVMENPGISIFVRVLQATGYDRFLKEEQALTVFAPQDAALQQLSLSDTAALKLWVQNYIAYLSYYTGADGNFNRSGGVVDGIEMINRKTIPAGVASLSGSKLITANRTCKNGVLHIIDNTVADRKN
ncbi:MAG: fasciclin domain-containing protein, partial [Dysgonamonadaceae bacterium]|nr:fasciclin domain-containing protein [Dysgonamonadaceae bacterium]